MSNLPWVRFFPSDWLAGTRGMSAAETGVYITIIAMMYDEGGPIRGDEARLSRLCGLPTPAFRKIRSALVSDGKIIETDDGLWNERVADELGFRNEKSEAARNSADRRWAKNKTKSTVASCERSTDAVQTQCYPEAREEDSSLRSLSAAQSALDLDDAARGKTTQRTPARSPATSAKGSRLPADWQPSPEMVAHAEGLGFTHPEIRIETEKIRDWSINSPHGAKRDWAAAWRNWLKTALERKQQNAGRRFAPAAVEPFSSDPRIAQAVRSLRGGIGTSDPLATVGGGDQGAILGGNSRDRGLAVFDAYIERNR